MLAPLCIWLEQPCCKTSLLMDIWNDGGSLAAHHPGESLSLFAESAERRSLALTPRTQGHKESDPNRISASVLRIHSCHSSHAGVIHDHRCGILHCTCGLMSMHELFNVREQNTVSIAVFPTQSRCRDTNDGRHDVKMRRVRMAG